MKSKFKKIAKNPWFIFSIVLLLALALRLSLVNFFYHLDILSQAYWGEWIYNNGPKGFYENSVWVYSWPSQPPLVNLVYALGFWLYRSSLELFVNFSHIIVNYRLAPSYNLWYFDFVKWYTDAQYPESYLKLGFFISIKFIAILADLFIGLIIFLMFKRENFKRALILSGIYLFSPFSFYISALWGQYDQVSFLFLILAFLAVFKKLYLIAPFLLMVSISMKPTSVIFIPFFLITIFKFGGSIKKFILGSIFATAGFLLSLSAFTDKDLIQFTTHDLATKVIYKAGFRVSTNSFNFWHIFIGNNAREHFVTYFFIPAYVWGYIALIVLNILAFINLKDKTLKSLITSMAIVGAGSWIFGINMLERYFFAGVVSMLLLTFFYPKLLKYWIVLSLIFWVNLYHGWWVPREWDFLRQVLIWNDHSVSRIFSLITLLIFLIYLKQIDVLKRIKELTLRLRVFLRANKAS